MPGCPFMAGVGSLGLKCPFTARSEVSTAKEASTSQEPHPSLTPVESPPSSSPAVCPYGFKSSASSAPKLSALQCMICKAFYHRCVELGCKHKFCLACIAGKSESCIKCGCDIHEMADDHETQALVDDFLAKHITMLEGQQAGREAAPSKAQQTASEPAMPNMPALPAMPGATPVAGFMLQLGLQSLKGGNPVAALDRLEECKRKVMADAGITLEPSQQGPELELPPICGDLGARVAAHAPAAGVPSSLACLLGAVYGSQGDACRQMGALQAASALYAASAACLRDAADAGAEEAAHALTVSINKLGDSQYLAQDLRAAAEAYARALHVRQRGLQEVVAAAGQSQVGAGAAGSADQQAKEHEPGKELLPIAQLAQELPASCAAQALDVAASLIKVADARGGQGDTAAAQQASADAELLLSAVLDSLQGGSEADADGVAMLSTSSSTATGGPKGVHEKGQQEAAPGGGAQGPVPAPDAQLLAKQQHLAAVLRQLQQSHRTADNDKL